LTAGAYRNVLVFKSIIGTCPDHRTTETDGSGSRVLIEVPTGTGRHPISNVFPGSAFVYTSAVCNEGRKAFGVGFLVFVVSAIVQETIATDGVKVIKNPGTTWGDIRPEPIHLRFRPCYKDRSRWEGIHRYR